MRAILVIASILVLANASPIENHGYQYDTPQVNYQAVVPDQSSSYESSGETLPNFVPVQANDGPALPPVYPDTQQPDNFIPTGPSDVQLQGVPLFSQTAPEQQNTIATQALTTGSGEAYRNTNEQQQQAYGTSYDSIPSGIPQQQTFGGSQQVQQSFAGSQQQVQQSFAGSQQQAQQAQQSYSSSQQQVQRSFSSSQQQAQQSFGSSQNQISTNTFSSQSDEELPPIITKHFYVHAAPEEPEESEGPRFVNIGRKQKNYKIIFIKAPTYGFNSQVIPIVQPNEEKTIVYVLSKKPSYNQDISLPPVPVTEPTKPEVFFIKYKTEGEAQEAQQKIQGAYETANLGESNDNIFTNVAGTIGNTVSNFQNQAASTFNSVVGQAQGVASGFVNNAGSVVTQIRNDEHADSNESANSVASQQQLTDEAQYLPPNQH